MSLDLTEQKFHRLTVLEPMGTNKHGARLWRCRCDCGNSVDVVSQDLRRGHTKSCGCHKLELHTKRLKTHGMSKTPEFKTWWNIQERCYNPKNPAYPHYGAKGIRVCDRWRESFQNFFEDMGKRPSGDFSIDRINNAGHYEPANCRWASKRDQALNRGRTRWHEYNGERLCQKDWALRLGVSREAITYWLHEGLTFPQIVEHFAAASDNRPRRHWHTDTVLGHDIKRPHLIPAHRREFL